MSAGVGSRCIPSKRDRRRGWESSSDSSVPPRLESSREEEEEEEEEEGGGVDGTVPGEMEDATSDDGRNCEGEKPMHVERGAMRRMSLIVVVSSTRERKQGMAGRAAIGEAIDRARDACDAHRSCFQPAGWEKNG
jgi:hypothetical protein